MARKRTIKKRKLIKKRALLPYRQPAKESTLQSLHNRNKRLEKMLTRHDERCKRQLLDRDMTIRILKELRNTFGAVDMFAKRLRCSTAVPDVCAMSHVTNMKQYILHCFVTMTRMVNKKLIKEDGKTPTSASKTLRKEMEATFQKIKGPIQSLSSDEWDHLTYHQPSYETMEGRKTREKIYNMNRNEREPIMRLLGTISYFPNYARWNESYKDTQWPRRINNEHTLVDQMQGRFEWLERDNDLRENGYILFRHLVEIVLNFSYYTDIAQQWLKGTHAKKESDGRLKRFANVLLPGWLKRRLSQESREASLSFENQITEEMETISRKIQQGEADFSAELKLVVRKISRKQILDGG